APVTCVLLPLFAWRAWRSQTGPALAQAGVLAVCAVVQAWCVWAAGHHGPPLPPRAQGLDLGVFAATVWTQTLILPLLRVDRAQAFGQLIVRWHGVGPVVGLLLLALAGSLLGWLARGLRLGERGALVGAYVLVTTLSLLTTIGDKAMLLHSPWAS